MSGERVAEPVTDWGFVVDRDTVELEVNPAAPRSITTWVVVPPRSSVTVTSKLSEPNKSGSVGVKVQAPVAALMAAVPLVAGVETVK